MSTMLIGYDLNRPGQSYEELFEEIKVSALGGTVSTRRGSSTQNYRRWR